MSADENDEGLFTRVAVDEVAPDPGRMRTLSRNTATTPAPGAILQVIETALHCKWPAALASVGAATAFNLLHFHPDWIPWFVVYGVTGICARLGDALQHFWNRWFPQAQ